EELELLVVRQRGALARRPGDDDPVRAVVDEVGRELPEPLHVDRPFRVERRDHGGEDFTEHAWILRARDEGDTLSSTVTVTVKKALGTIRTSRDRRSGASHRRPARVRLRQGGDDHVAEQLEAALQLGMRALLPGGGRRDEVAR